MAYPQACKTGVAVGYQDDQGKLRPGGLTKEQGEFWQKQAPKRYPGFCLNTPNPQWLVIWKVGLDAPPDVKAIARGAQTPLGPGPWQGANYNGFWSPEVSAGDTWVALHSRQVQGKAYYFVFDMGKDPPVLAKKGSGYLNVPVGATAVGRLEPGSKVSEETFSSTLADPVEALKNALDWIKKDAKTK